MGSSGYRFLSFHFNPGFQTFLDQSSPRFASQTLISQSDDVVDFCHSGIIGPIFLQQLTFSTEKQ
jgi:hypothetical protein